MIIELEIRPFILRAVVYFIDSQSLSVCVCVCEGGWCYASDMWGKVESENNERPEDFRFLCYLCTFEQTSRNTPSRRRGHVKTPHMSHIKRFYKLCVDFISPVLLLWRKKQNKRTNAQIHVKKKITGLIDLLIIFYLNIQQNKSFSSKKIEWLDSCPDLLIKLNSVLTLYF